IMFSEKFSDHSKKEIEFNAPYKVLFETIKFLYIGEAEFDDIEDVLEAYKFANEIGCELLESLCLKSITVSALEKNKIPIPKVVKMLMDYHQVNEKQVFTKAQELFCAEKNLEQLKSEENEVSKVRFYVQTNNDNLISV